MKVENNYSSLNAYYIIHNYSMFFWRSKVVEDAINVGICLGHPANFKNVENIFMIFLVINTSMIFFISVPPFLFWKISLSKCYVAFVNGRLEAYLFFSGVRSIVRSIWWILVCFRCHKRRGICKGIRIDNLYKSYGFF